MPAAADLQYWLNLQSAMRDLQKSQGWDTFVQQVTLRREEAVKDLLSNPATDHNTYVGFIHGLDWVLGYPDHLIEVVQSLRK